MIKNIRLTAENESPPLIDLPGRRQRPEGTGPPRSDARPSRLGAGRRWHGPGTLPVGHSLGCHTSAPWALGTRVLRVAPPDLLRADAPAGVHGHIPLALQPLPFRSIVVAGSDDPHGNPVFARDCARAWGADVVAAGALGHIDADRGIGAWAQGQDLLWSPLRP